jgi:threonine dehydrogenase-like Zn-dependent dehydrogenase
MQFTLNEYPYCDGGYAEYYFLPPGHYVFKVPDILPDDAIPPVNCAMCQVLHGLEYCNMQFGDVVVIQGAGGLGIYAAAIAAETGASTGISIDKQPRRLDFATKCGATDVIDMNEPPTPEARVQRKDLTDGRGADVVVEVVGIAAATVEGLDMVRLGGKFVDIGNIVPQPVSFPAIKVIAQQVNGRGSAHCVDHAGRARVPGAHAGQIPALESRLAQLPARGGQQGVRVRRVAGQGTRARPRHG